MGTMGSARWPWTKQSTKPQGLYEHRQIDLRRLRELILDGKLSPCYTGAEEGGADLEECPICLLVIS